MRTHTLLLSACLSAGLTLSACGGGGGGGGGGTVVTPPPPPPPPPSNNVPQAAATTDMSTVLEGRKVRLDASGSTDADNDTLTYSWTQIAGTAARIDTPNEIATDVTFFDVAANETATFQVSVSDGTDAGTATVNVTVENIAQTPAIAPNSANTIALATTAKPVAIAALRSANISDETDTADLRYILTVEEGAMDTSNATYEFEYTDTAADEGSAALNTPATNAVFSADVRFLSGFNATEFVRLVALDAGTDTVSVFKATTDETAPTLERQAALSITDPCMAVQQIYFNGTDQAGLLLVGKTSGGVEGFTFDPSETSAGDITSTIAALSFGGSKSYCGFAQTGVTNTTTGRLDSRAAFLDVDTMMVDEYSIVLEAGETVPTVTFTRTLDPGLSDAVTGLNFQMSDQGSGISALTFSDGAYEGTHKLFVYGYDPLSGFGGDDPTLEVDEQSWPLGAPSDLRIATFLNANSSADTTIAVVTPDTPQIVEFDTALFPIDVSPPGYVEVGIGATQLSTDALNGFVVAFGEAQELRAFVAAE